MPSETSLLSAWRLYEQTRKEKQFYTKSTWKTHVLILLYYSFHIISLHVCCFLCCVSFQQLLSLLSFFHSRLFSDCLSVSAGLPLFFQLSFNFFFRIQAPPPPPLFLIVVFIVCQPLFVPNRVARARYALLLVIIRSSVVLYFPGSIVYFLFFLFVVDKCRDSHRVLLWDFQSGYKDVFRYHYNKSCFFNLHLSLVFFQIFWIYIFSSSSKQSIILKMKEHWTLLASIINVILSHHSAVLVYRTVSEN